MGKKIKQTKEQNVAQAILNFNRKLKKIRSTKPERGGLNIITEYEKKELDHVIRILEHSGKQSPLNWKTAKQKFFTTIGIEYTFLKKKDDKRSVDDIVKKMTEMSDKRQKWNRNFHMDGSDVIETASPPHKNWKEMLAVYRKLNLNAKKLDLVHSRDDKGGGAGHIHMGLPKSWSLSFTLKFLKVLHMDIASRPYLNWIFNEPSDERNANSMLMREEGVKFLKETHDSYYSYINFGKLKDISAKCYAVRYDDEFDTVEFRIFNMMENEQVLEEYVEFANAYFRYIYNVTKMDYYSNGYGVEYYNLHKGSFDKFKDKKNVVDDFNKLLRSIGLNPQRYRKYITKNYDERVRLREAGHLKMDFDYLNEIQSLPDAPKDNGVDKAVPCEDAPLREDVRLGSESAVQDNLFEPVTTSSMQTLELTLDVNGNYKFEPQGVTKSKIRKLFNSLIDSFGNFTLEEFVNKKDEFIEAINKSFEGMQQDLELIKLKNELMEKLRNLSNPEWRAQNGFTEATSNPVADIYEAVPAEPAESTSNAVEDMTEESNETIELNSSDAAEVASQREGWTHIGSLNEITGNNIA